ncbi:DNA internalization-related competence protein ComEC/Rec2 [Caldibacillus lycopersici]|uniref:DNA internalization-related competence protein ComEC/Rec2 n=1 Tax=Perspicuibacillus lycopersici TaxID=1325689 RepID=A0AAE3IT82_9BACI|nr:DNA internalization-related competence protein ComEC/Rec2 [Perspicuibacillus lycopersici]MCU9613942.1 DNA internalization-related competence protein ComEC/Rec2 [Perspicuibacillus lycopersici]
MPIFYGIFAYLSFTVLLGFLSFYDFSLGLISLISFCHLLHYRLPRNRIYLLIVSFSFWLLLFKLNLSPVPISVPETDVHETIRFIEYPVFDGNKMSANVNINGRKIAVSYWLNSKTEKDHLRTISYPGVICSVNGNYEIPSQQRNPNAFNYRQFLLTEKIYYTMTIHEMKECHIGKRTFLDYLLIIRENSIAEVNRVFPTHIAPFINALLFGEDRGMEEEDQAAYQSLGLSHLLAISGLHVSILSVSLFFLLLRFGFTKEFARNFLLFVLPLYAVFAGMSPSVNRAVFMSWCVLFLSKWKDTFLPIDALGFSFLFFILRNPAIIYHVGFQLSYLVTACLLLSSAILKKHARYLTSSVLIALLAQLASLPVILFHFYEFSLVSCLMNIIFVPLYSFIILPLCIVMFIIILIMPSLIDFFANLLMKIVELANSITNWISHFDLFTITLGKPPVFLFIFYFFTIIVLFFVIEKYWLQKKGLLFLLLFTPIIFQLLFVKWSPFGEVTFIDVGQGDSILIRLPFNQGNYLIDTGGNISYTQEEWEEQANPYDPGEKIVLPLLKSRGITHLDKLILTHGDMDHIGSAKTIIEKLPIKQLLVGDTIHKKAFELEIIALANKKNIEVIHVYEGLKWAKGKYDFHILAPRLMDEADNDASIVIYAIVAGKRWLFTGDLEEAGEKQLIEKYPQLRVDILKVGHHGSNTSTTAPFLSKIKPKAAIISVGERNRYGHPHQEILDRLQENTIDIYRTDKNGAVSYSFFLNKGRFSTVID